VGLFFCFQSIPQTFATDTAKIEFAPSQWGIDYTKFADYPLSAILSHGEIEFRRNAASEYEEDTRTVWADDLAPEIGTGAISEATIEEMKEFTPQMLIQFAVRLDPKDKKYGGLWSVGNAFIASKIAGALSKN
jgi:hypothetical protein